MRGSSCNERITMEQLDILIICGDRDYSTALAKSLSRNSRGLDIFMSGSVPRDTGCYDIIITDIPRVRDELRERHKDRQTDGPAGVILLCEKAAYADAGNDVFFKYGDIREMISAMSIMSARGAGKVSTSRLVSDTDIYVFASLLGGSGCTSLALAFAETVNRMTGKNAVYISAEPFPQTSLHMERRGAGTGEGKYAEAEAGLKNYLYHLLYKKTAPDPGSYFTETASGVAAFKMPAGINPLTELDEEGTELFLDSLEKSPAADVIVVDAGKALLPGYGPFFRRAKRVFMLEDGRPYEAEAFGYVEKLTDAGTVRIINRSKPAGPDEGTDERTVFRIPEDAASFMSGDGRISIRETGEFMRRTQQIVERFS